MKRKRWTKNDDAELAEMWRQYSLMVIAEHFSVSESSVLHRARRLNLKGRNGIRYKNRKAVRTSPSMPFVPIGRD